jgi:hypothetical protein
VPLTTFDIAYPFLFSSVMYFPFRITLSWLARIRGLAFMLVKATLYSAVLIGVYLIILPVAYLDLHAPPVTLDFVAPPFFMVLEVFVFALLIAVLIASTHAVIWLFKRVFWPVAEYSKGPLAGLLVIVTAILAMLTIITSK